ncbi:hypothetical protein TKK_0007487 [Trichogramma kaykai]|uniref:Uncharacterized protein n=1 Tax=Trichogramma kaykai TaxID=54128 RepID=A0ABD2WH04_9HYME
MDKAGLSEQLQAFNYQERRITTWLKNFKAKVQEAIKNQRDSTELGNAGLLEDKINIQLVLHRALLNGQEKSSSSSWKQRRGRRRQRASSIEIRPKTPCSWSNSKAPTDGFDLRYFSHFLIWYMVGSSRDDEIATEFVKNFPSYRRSYGRLDRMSLLIARRSVTDLHWWMLKLLLEMSEGSATAALPDFCRYHRRDTDASSFMQASLQLRERTKEVQRLLGGCNCRGANAKDFVTLPAFHGFLHHSRKLANLTAHREAQLSHLRDFLATRRSP